MANRIKLTTKRRSDFLAALSDGFSITHAATLIGMARRYMYEVRDGDEDFARDWDAAIEDGTDKLEDEARRRAQGWDEPVFQMGVEVGTHRRYSDTLMTLLLKARRPDQYRERISTEHTGAGGGPLTIKVTFAD